MSDKHNGLKRRGYLCWEDLSEEAHAYLGRERLTPNPGLLVLRSPALDILLHLGLCDEINRRCGILLDMYEEEVIEPQLLLEAADSVHTLSGRLASRSKVGETINVEVGEQTSPPSRSIIAEASTVEIARALTDIEAFFRDAALRGKRVIVSL